MSFPPAHALCLAAAFLSVAPVALAQAAVPAPPPALTAAEIVDQMQAHNLARSAALTHYKAFRHYTVQYHGFSTEVVAAMDVEITYDAATGKHLRIVSQTGSKFLCDKVLRRAVESELEASRDKNSTALSQANYKFRLEGLDALDGRPAYILAVEPLVASKFLYRGKIWVDAQDFAVARMETEPAKNPSFWIAHTAIHYTAAGHDNFWLPAQLRSETRVRIGGTATLTIDYGAYSF